MTIELRVLTGARAGHRARFEGPAVTVGRHPRCDLQLDTHEDLDVSSRHAELRMGSDGFATVTDLGSTNGTFVNGARVQAVRLEDGDVVQLGTDGPRIEVRFGAAVGVERRASSAVSESAARRGADTQRRRSTRYVIPVALLLAGIAAAYGLGARRSATEVAELRRLVEGHDSMTRSLSAQLRGVSDTAVLATLQRANDSLRAVAQAGSVADRADVRGEVGRLRESTQALAALDMPAINAANAPAIAYVVAEVEGRAVAGTAFAVDTRGRMLTNRHLVRSATGAQATRIAVKFRDRRDWQAARVIRTAAGEHDDLALLELVNGATVPTVRGIAQDDAAFTEGAPIVTIGFPLGRATMMEGGGDDFVAKTSLYPGTVSKVLPEVLQLATFAGHGSSGSPVFDARGLVVGVVWGGPPEGEGRIVYAVPAARIRELLAP